MQKNTAHKVTIQVIDGCKDIVIDHAKPSKTLQDNMMTRGFWYSSQVQGFRTPLAKSQVLRLDSVKGLIDNMTWNTQVVEEFAKVLTL